MKPMLANPPEPDKYPLRMPMYASPKLDGIRCLIIDGEPVTRTLKPIPNNYIREKLTGLPPLDGELIVGAANAPMVYNTTSSAVMSHDGEPDFTFWVFDLLDKPLLVFHDRLVDLLEGRENLPSFVKIVRQTVIHSSDELSDYYGRCLEDGYEGAMIRSPNGFYKQGRSTAKEQTLLKVKPFADYEAIVLDVYEAQHNTNEAKTNALGRTERSSAKAGLVGKGIVGGFRVVDVLTKREFDVAPGAMTHGERAYWWIHREEAKGKILTYRCMEHGSLDAPRFTRFMRWRGATDTLGV